MAQLVLVGHAKKPNWGLESVGPAPKYPDDFVLVASVEVPDEETHLEEYAFHQTNHIDGPWWENPGVTKLVTGPVRSTSVGDVVVLPNRQAYQVAVCGFELLTPHPQGLNVAASPISLVLMPARVSRGEALPMGCLKFRAPDGAGTLREVSVAFDDSCGAMQELSRVDIRCYLEVTTPEGGRQDIDVTGSVFPEAGPHGTVYGTIEDLLVALHWLDPQLNFPIDLTQSTPSP